MGKRGLLPAHDRDMYTKKTTDVEKLYATSQTERKRCWACFLRYMYYECSIFG